MQYAYNSRSGMRDVHQEHRASAGSSSVWAVARNHWRRLLGGCGRPISWALRAEWEGTRSAPSLRTPETEGHVHSRKAWHLQKTVSCLVRQTRKKWRFQSKMRWSSTFSCLPQKLHSKAAKSWKLSLTATLKRKKRNGHFKIFLLFWPRNSGKFF